LQLLSRQPNRHKDLRDAGIESAMRAIHGGRGRTTSSVGFGEYVGTVSSGDTHGTSMNIGLMGREEDHEVREAVKQALLWFERARERDSPVAPHVE
jgi:hypothetical protein